MVYFYYMVRRDNMSTYSFHAKKVLSPNKVIHSWLLLNLGIHLG